MSHNMVGEFASFEDLDQGLARRRGWSRRHRGRGIVSRPWTPGPAVISDVDDMSGTSLVTIGEDASLDDLGTLEHLEYLESIGQLDDLGKSKLKKLRKKISKVVKKVTKPIKKIVKKAAKVVKSAAKVLYKISPIGVTAALLKKGKKFFKRKKSGGGEEVVVVEEGQAPPADGVQMTDQEYAAWQQAFAQQYAQQQYAQQQASYPQQYAAAGGGAPSSNMWPVEEPGAEGDEGDQGEQGEGGGEGEDEGAAPASSIPGMIRAATDGGAATQAAAGSTMPGWVLPTVIVGSVAVVGIGAYFLFFRKKKV